MWVDYRGTLSTVYNNGEMGHFHECQSEFAALSFSASLNAKLKAKSHVLLADVQSNQ